MGILPLLKKNKSTIRCGIGLIAQCNLATNKRYYSKLTTNMLEDFLYDLSGGTYIRKYSQENNKLKLLL